MIVLGGLAFRHCITLHISYVCMFIPYMYSYICTYIRSTYMDYLLLRYILLNYIKSMLSYITSLYHSCYYYFMILFCHLTTLYSNKINRYRRCVFDSPRGGGGILYASQDKKYFQKKKKKKVIIAFI